MSVIDVPDPFTIEEVQIDDLISVNTEWYKPANSLMTQHLGDEWLKSLSSVVLKVPSAIIQFEYNSVEQEIYLKNLAMLPNIKSCQHWQIMKDKPLPIH